MTNNKIIVAGVVGAMSLLLIGSLLFGLTLPQFGETLNGSAIGVMKSPEEFGWIALIIGHLAYGWLFAIIFGRWANISTFAGGAKAGLILAALISLGNELISFGSTNVASFTGTMVDIVLGTIVFALMGGVVGAMLGRGEKSGLGINMIPNLFCALTRCRGAKPFASLGFGKCRDPSLILLKIR